MRALPYAFNELLNCLLKREAGKMDNLHYGKRNNSLGKSGRKSHHILKKKHVLGD